MDDRSPPSTECTLTGATLVDVTHRRLLRADLLVRGGVIAGIGRAGQDFPHTETRIDLTGTFLAPGLIDPHLHIESSLLSPAQFALEAVRHGTTGILADPHEIANVIGCEGIGMFLRDAETLPLDLFVGIPSCVPATPLEDAGAEITAADVAALLPHPGVFGLAEMMNVPAILHGWGEAREKVTLACDMGKLVDGHCPGLTGEDLLTYVSNGCRDGKVRIMSDHECTAPDEALEKHRAGMTIAMRFGSAGKDLPRILPGLPQARPGAGFAEGRFMVCSDDLDPVELVEEGHMERIVREARYLLRRQGWDPEAATVEALALATVHPGRYAAPFLRSQGHPPMGELAIGQRANLVAFDALDSLRVMRVFHHGRMVFDGTRVVPPAALGEQETREGVAGWNTLHLPRRFEAGDFALRHRGREGTVDVNVIGLTDGLPTRLRKVTCPVREGEPLSPPGTSKIAVIERHGNGGGFSVGFVDRCLAEGAVATTVSHDSHNLMVLGADDRAMAEAVNRLGEWGGGMVAVGGEVVHLPLPLGGLMSTENAETVARGYQALREAVRRQGGHPNLFMRISFLALPVIPEVRITNRGLVDVGRFDFMPLYG